MNTRKSTLVIAIAGVLLAQGPASSRAAADDAPRPTEDALFGTIGTPSKPAPLDPSSDRDAFASGEVTDNALTLGGIYYQRMIFSGQQGTSLGNTPLTMPLQFDGFMDARPNDRVRGFVDARLLYDPTRDQYSKTTGGNSSSSSQYSSTATAPSSLSGLTTAIPNNPQVALDQAWLKFDIQHAAFITAGKQHVKWGTSRFWNPTDLLSSQRRDPLLPYDLRLGNTMVKVNLPFEAHQTNVYAIALLDNVNPASTLGQIGGAFRAEKVIGNTEIGIDLIDRGESSPVYGADISSPLGQFDVYAEAACVTGNSPSYSLTGTPTAGADISSLYQVSDQTGPFAEVSGGGNYSFAWRDNRQATVGLEYFYNQRGYTSSSAYPILIFNGQYQPFYTGRHYAAFYLTAEGPDAEKHTSYTFSALGNLSDMSFVTRLDLAWRILTYLSFEPYVDAHFGSAGGEFNFALNTPTLTTSTGTLSAIDIPPTFFDVGLALRVSF